MTSSENTILPLDADNKSGFADDYLPALLAQAHQLISSEFHRVAEARGIAVAEWRTLSTLANGQALSLGSLAQRTVIKQPTLTRMIDRMETRGFVERIGHAVDRRITLVKILPAGKTAVAELMLLAREHEQRVLLPFGIESASALKQILKSLIRLHAPPPPDDP